MSVPWLRPVDPQGYRTLSPQQQAWREWLTRRREDRQRAAVAASAAVAWSLRYSARPDLLVEAMREVER